jgi:hypothetical protein
VTQVHCLAETSRKELRTCCPIYPSKRCQKNCVLSSHSEPSTATTDQLPSRSRQRPQRRVWRLEPEFSNFRKVPFLSNKPKNPIHQGTGASARGTTLVDRTMRPTYFWRSMKPLGQNWRAIPSTKVHRRSVLQVTLEVRPKLLTPIMGHSLGRLRRELRKGSTGWGFQSEPRTSLSASTNLLSSINAFRVGYSVVAPIIREITPLSRKIIRQVEGFNAMFIL